MRILSVWQTLLLGVIIMFKSGFMLNKLKPHIGLCAGAILRLFFFCRWWQCIFVQVLIEWWPCNYQASSL